MDCETLNLIFRCNKEFSHKQTRGQKLTEMELSVLSAVYGQPGSSQDEIAAAVKTDKTTVSKAVGVLESKKLIRRRQDKKDHRVMRLKATKEGYRVLTGLLDIHNAMLEKILSCLNEEERAQFLGYTERVLKSALAVAEERNKEKAAERAAAAAEMGDD